MQYILRLSSAFLNIIKAVLDLKDILEYNNRRQIHDMIFITINSQPELLSATSTECQNTGPRLNCRLGHQPELLHSRMSRSAKLICYPKLPCRSCST